MKHVCFNILCIVVGESEIVQNLLELVHRKTMNVRIFDMFRVSAQKPYHSVKQFNHLVIVAEKI